MNYTTMIRAELQAAKECITQYPGVRSRSRAQHHRFSKYQASGSSAAWGEAYDVQHGSQTYEELEANFWG